MAKKAKPEDSVLVETAKAIGRTAGKIANLVGAEPTKSTKKGKLPKKNNPRLPRRQKKAKLRAAASKSN